MLIDTSIFRGVRLNKFVIRAGKQNRNILYNTATGAIVVINGEEDLNNSLDQLKRMFFYVPEDFDEISWVNDLRKTKIAKEKNNIITGYTIFSTSDCNARCFYCFEKGAQRNDMSPKTALDVANFITKKCNGNKVVLRWFGGEPLLNTKAMDIICETLKNNSIEFTSTMISNGSLFNNSNVTKAKNLWNLKGVQITLDGTKNVYQKAKSYVNSDGKEYDKVIENIEFNFSI
ncbi:MAG: 4Fe-4S cluster-binding domain-containing protein [Paludibacteraceae bacterium]|nr:4Fe-4S cluster-binding domain-containing protein [Paludibacteraceae bacterium]